MRQNITVALLAICVTLLAVNVVQQMVRPGFPQAFGQAVGNAQGNYILATGMTTQGNNNMLYVLEVPTRRLAAYSVAKRGIEYMGTRDITWDMKIEHLAPLGKRLAPADMKKAIQKNQLGGRKPK